MTKTVPPRALGAYVFAGGFTQGVKQHFRVEAHLEEGPFGVKTSQLNHGDTTFHAVGEANWNGTVESLFPVDPATGWRDIAFLFGNPPCAAWSPAAGARINLKPWQGDARVDCTRRHFALLEKYRPVFWAWESVQQAFKVGRPLVDELTYRAVKLGYSVTYLLHDAQYLGVPQVRKRFFMVCHLPTFDVDELTWENESCGAALARVNDPGPPLRMANEVLYSYLLDHIIPGEDLRQTWERITPKPWKLNARGQVVGRPSFLFKRPRPERPSNVVMNEMIHPSEKRWLTHRELALLCGFPPMYEFTSKDYGLISRGVCPPVGEWLARNVARCLARNERSPPRVQLIDVSAPPGSVTQLPVPQPNITISSAILPGTLVEAENDEAEAYEQNVRAMETVGLSRATAIMAASAKLAGTEANTVIIDERQPVPPRPTRAPRPKPHVKSGAYLQLLISMGYSTTEILSANREHFPASKAGPADVSYHRGKLKRRQVPLPSPTVPDVNPDPALPQPTRTTTPPERDQSRRYDTSALLPAHGRWVHRDYGAHFFRWGFVGRLVNEKQDTTEVLDVGCGIDQPLLKALNHPRCNVPKRYVGVDINACPKRENKYAWSTCHWEFDFIERFKELGTFDVVTCLEVIEHMHEPDGHKLLTALREVLKPTGRLLLSTPVFNGHAAANHLHEWRLDELAAAVVATGFSIERRYGTFASARDLKKVMAPEHAATYDALRCYYDNEVMATFLAPLYPDASRNNLWVLRRAPVA